MPSVPDFLSEDDAERVAEIMEAHGYEELTGTQRQAFDEGALDDENTLLVAETGNGKTMVAEAVLKKTLDEGGRAAYLVPSYQLTQSKKAELEEWMGDEYSVGTGTGAIRRTDVPVMTFESYFQAVMRNIGDIRSFDRAIFDDFHEVYSYHRGPGIEKAMTACLDHDIDVFGMSATVGNPDELASWLNATLIESDSDRSIPVVEEPVENDPNASRGEQLASIIDENEDKAPFIVFNNRRDWAETRGEDIADTGLFEDANDRDFHTEIERALPAEMTSKYERLADMMEAGVAFHHSGLDASVRDVIVDAVKEGDLMCVSATPGLAYGFDAPIQSVIVADLKRYGDWIGVYEYIQWIGRAGRPGYGYDKGYAFPLYKDEQAHDYFQFGTPSKQKELEDVQTHIESDEEFRQLLLELIDFGWQTPDEIEGFLQHSLFWEQYSGAGAWGREYDSTASEIERKLRQTANWLEHRDLVTERRARTEFETTDLGEAAIEFNYETWLDTPLEGITNVHRRLPRVVDDPLELVSLLASEFGRAQLRSLPDTATFEGQLRDHGLRVNDASKTAAMLCWHWARGRSLDDLEAEFDVDMTGVPSAGRNAAGLLESTEHLIDVADDIRKPEWYDTLVGQLRYGVPAENLLLAEEVDQLGRGRIGTLSTKIQEMSAVDTTATLPEQLSELYDEAGRDLFTDTISDQVSGVGDTIAGRLADAVEQWNGVPAQEAPPIVPPGKQSRSGNDDDGPDVEFTEASKLDDFE